LFVDALSDLFPKQIKVLDEESGKHMDIFVWWIYITDFGAKHSTYNHNGKKYKLTTAAKLYSFMKDVCEEDEDYIECKTKVSKRKAPKIGGTD